MEKKQNKTMEFVKAHWKKFAIAAGTVIGGAIVYEVAKHNGLVGPINLNWRAEEDARIEKLGWSLGTMTSLWEESGYVRAIVNDLKVSDLGKFGNELLKIDGVTNDTVVDAVIGLGDFEKIK